MTLVWEHYDQPGIVVGNRYHTRMRLCTFYESCMLHCNHMVEGMKRCVVSRLDKTNASLIIISLNGMVLNNII